MERVVVTITSDLFDESNQEASIRKNVSVRSLMGEIQKEFTLQEGNYALRLRGKSTVLDVDKTIEQLGIQTGAELIFSRERRSASRASAGSGSSSRSLSGVRGAYIKEETTGKIWEIEWQPAIIGRPDAGNTNSGTTLAVDLGGFEEARSVSRQHASITERSGNYFVESLSDRNPAYLNGESIFVGERARLRDGDEILIGKIALTFRLREGSGATTSFTQQGKTQ